MSIELTKYTLEFLEYSWTWLNDDEIRKLTDTPIFDAESQKKWFNSISSKKDYLIWGILFEGIPIGACGLKNITITDCEYWGYIGNKNYWGKGIGTEMLQKLIEIGKQKKLNSIWLKVLKDNDRARKLYEKLGFYVENESDAMLFMRKEI